jgi:hypothetical protein
MPTPLLAKYANMLDMPIKDVEERWNHAKKIAKDEGHHPGDEGYWPIVVGILKRMLGLKHKTTMKEWLEISFILE